MRGAQLGRQNLSWRKPPLLWWKTLGVLITRLEGIPVARIEALHERTAQLFPAVTKLLGQQFTEIDVLAVCRAQDLPYTYNKFRGRVDSAIRWGEKLDLAAVETAYRQVCAVSHLRPRGQRK